MARPRQQPPPEPPKPVGKRRSPKPKPDADGITWPPPITGWHDADGTWHPGDPRRALYENWTVPTAATSIDHADAGDRAARAARDREMAHRQAATEQARRPVRATPDNTPAGRPIRVNRKKES